MKATIIERIGNITIVEATDGRYAVPSELVKADGSFTKKNGTRAYTEAEVKLAFNFVGSGFGFVAVQRIDHKNDTGTFRVTGHPKYYYHYEGAEVKEEEAK